MLWRFSSTGSIAIKMSIVISTYSVFCAIILSFSHSMDKTKIVKMSVLFCTTKCYAFSINRKRVKNMTPEELQDQITKLQNGELSEAQEIELLKEISFSYDVLNKFLEELKMEQLKSEM